MLKAKHRETQFPEDFSRVIVVCGMIKTSSKHIPFQINKYL